MRSNRLSEATLAKLENYEWIREVGGGPITVIHQVYDPVSAQTFALKCLRESEQDEEASQELLAKEASIGRKLAHPNIVRYGLAHVDAQPYFLLTEWLEGETLRQKLQRQKCLNWRECIEILVPLCRGLKTMHRLGFIHGDIKPENIFLTDSGEIKWIDLGFAHKAHAYSRMLEEGFLLGTANYVAPELCDEFSPDEPPSDLFSFGVTFFEMLTGRLPYPEGEIEDVLVRHRDDAPDSLDDYSGDWPAKLVPLVDHLLHRDPARRPTAESLERQLAGYRLNRHAA